MTEKIKNMIVSGNTSLGIELGSTRIKAVLVGEDYQPLAIGGYTWENQLRDGVWTYDLADVWTGVQKSFESLCREVETLYGLKLTTVGAVGVSGMMHGYLCFDEKDSLLIPFRTWRNTMTENATKVLTDLFQFNIPQRWSIAHLYQAVLSGEAHTKKIRFMTTLSGYVHWKLTGEKVLGIGDASGMFPINSTTNDYHGDMLEKFDNLVKDEKFTWCLREILPTVLVAGESAGALTTQGAKLLDPSGTLQPNIMLCPPEGDAGTGMVATNSVAKLTGNVSAGTSIFAMIVMERELSRVHPEIDMVTTPDGKPVAMVHCNNCSSDIDAWVNLFSETTAAFGKEVDKNTLYNTLYHKALEGDSDIGKLFSCNYFSGEHITGFPEGRPMLVRMPDSRLTLPNLMRSLLFSAMGTLKIGMDILTEDERVQVKQILGHGGFFKTKEVGQRLMAAALGVPVTVMSSASEGGSWGIALLAAFRKDKTHGETLDAFLGDKVFRGSEGSTINPYPEDIKSFSIFMDRYRKGLNVERSAVDNLK